MKNLLILLLLGLIPVANAQLFAPYQKTVDELVTFLGKDLDKATLKAFKKTLAIGSVTTNNGGRKVIGGFLDKKKNLRLAMDGYGKMESIYFFMDPYFAKAEKLSDVFPAMQGYTMAELVPYIEEQGWLEKPVYFKLTETVMGLIPNTTIVVILFDGGQEPSIEFSIEEKAIELHQRAYSRSKVSTSVCNEALVDLGTDYSNLVLPEGGKCLRGCDANTTSQVWHYGNAIYSGKIENGLPNDPNGRVYVFDLKDCNASANQIVAFKYWSGNIEQGVPQGSFDYYEKSQGDREEKYIGEITYENGKAVSVDEFAFDDQGKPTPLSDKFPVYTAALKNGVINDPNAIVYKPDIDLIYQLPINHGVPDLSEPVSIYHPKKNIGNHRSKLSKEDQYYFGMVDANWQPKGLGEIHFVYEEAAFTHDWIIKGTFLNPNKVENNSEVLLHDNNSGLTWSGIAENLSFNGNDFKLRGEFRVLTGMDTSTYSRGRFVTESIKLPSGTYEYADIPVPDGEHRAFTLLENGTYSERHLNTYDRGKPLTSSENYNYPAYEKFIESLPEDYYVDGYQEYKAQFREFLIEQLVSNYADASSHFEHYGELLKPRGTGTFTMIVYNLSPDDEVELRIDDAANYKTLGARTLAPASPAGRIQGLKITANKSGSAVSRMYFQTTPKNKGDFYIIFLDE